MYDLHSHILPGVDDGSKTFNESIAMANVAFDCGTRLILATPHRKDVAENSSVRKIRQLATDMNSDLSKNEIDLQILIGMENHLDLELPEDFSTDKALPMNGSRYALVELPFFGYPNYVEDVLFKLQIQGIIPILAHPERIEAVQINPELLSGFVERGMLSQITAGSILGHFGKKVQRLTHSLLRRGLVHVIASDAHFPDGPRSPNLFLGFEAAIEIVGEEKATEMVVDIPRAVLDDQVVVLEPPQGDSGNRRWWHLGRWGG